MKNRKIQIIGMVGVLLGAAALALFLWFRSTERGRALLRFLPPDADLYALADLDALQTNPGVRQFLSDPPGFSVEEDYKRFVEATGFRYQGDLRQLALAKRGSNWIGAARVRLDRARVLRYLESAPAEKTNQDGLTVFVLGRLRPFRLALREADLAVFTVGEDATLIRRALQRDSGDIAGSAAAQWEGAEATSRVPKGSALWLIGRMDRLLHPDQGQPEFPLFRLAQPLLRGSKTLTASVQSRLTRLEFQVENRCEDAAAAERIGRTLQSLLALLRAMPPDPSNPIQSKLPVLFKDVSIQQVEDSVRLQWQWDAETLRNLK